MQSSTIVIQSIQGQIRILMYNVQLSSFTATVIILNSTIISFYYCPKYNSTIKKKREEKNCSKNDVYWFLPHKTKQGKIGSSQLESMSKLIIQLLGS
jgi:hypothetical protein